MGLGLEREHQENTVFTLWGLRRYVNKYLNWGEGPPVKLAGLPSIKLFKYLDTIPIEAGVYEMGGQWHFMLGDFGSFPVMDVPDEANVVVHTHPGIRPWGGQIISYLPSNEDFIHGHTLTSRQFVSSALGITLFWPVRKWNCKSDELYLAIYHLKPPTLFLEEQVYLEQLKSYGCQWLVHPWRDIRDQKDLMRVLRED